jgi:hypothetical protein
VQDATQVINDIETLFSGFGLTGGISLLGQLISAMGGTLTGTGLLSDITSVFDEIPLIGPLVEDITGVAGGTGATLASFFSGLEGASGSILGQLVSAMGGTPTGGGVLTDITDIFDGLGGGIQDLINEVLGGTTHTASDLATFITGLLGPTSSLNAGNLVGDIPSDLLSILGLGSITSNAPNMLTAPEFSSAAQINGEGIWSWDGTQTAPGATGPGSVTVTANSVTNTLSSNNIAVSPGDTITQSIYAMWSGLVSTGAVIQLIANVYTAAETLLTTTVFDSVTPSSGTESWQQLTGNPYTVPSGAAFMSMGLRVLSTATAGQVWFGNGSYTKTGLLPQNSILDLPADLESITTNFQDWIDQGLGALTGIATTGNPLSALITALENIPFANVLGTLGGANIGVSLENAVDSIYQGIGSNSATGNSLAGLSNLANQLASFLGFMPGATAPSGTVAGITQNNNATIATQAVTVPSYIGIDPTVAAVFPLSTITGSSLTTVPVTADASLIGFIGTPNAGVAESIAWIGENTANITSMILNVYSVNTSTGELTKVYSSPNIISNVDSTLAWNYYNFPSSADYLTTAQGDWYAVEMQVAGTGTYNVVGIVSALPVHPTAIPAALGATRTGSPVPAAPSTISSPTYSTNVPWFGLAGSAGASQFPAQTTEYNTPGTFTLDVPTWVNFIDVIPLGGGGGGGGGQTGAGNPGSNTTITVGSTVVTGAGGAAAAGGTIQTDNSALNGQSPGTFDFNDQIYRGGATAGLVTQGNAPGGGGGGATAFDLAGYGGGAGSFAGQTFSAEGITTVEIVVGAGGLGNQSYTNVPSETAPGNGAPGAAWIVFRQ